MMRMRGSGLPQRLRLLSALAVPGVAGIAFLALGGAPVSYALVNLAALALAASCIASGGVACGSRARLGLGVALVAVIALPLLTGPAIDGVARWIPLGPMALHAGMAAAPLLVVQASGDARRGPFLLVGAMIAAAFQPDAATALALFAAAIALAIATRVRLWIFAAIIGAIALASALRVPGPPSQIFVEGVIAYAWAMRPLEALALVLALIWPVVVLARGDERTRLPRLALSAALTGYVAMSFIGPYPTPLIGYGAAPLLGFGLAFAGLTRFAARDVAGG